MTRFLTDQNLFKAILQGKRNKVVLGADAIPGIVQQDMIFFLASDEKPGTGKKYIYQVQEEAMKETKNRIFKNNRTNEIFEIFTEARNKLLQKVISVQWYVSSPESFLINECTV